MRLTLLLVLAISARAATVSHWLAIGQSLALGWNGCPVLSSTQPFSNLMLTANTSGTLTPLVENSVNATSSICGSTASESHGSSFANTLTNLIGSGISLVSHHAIGGTAYTGLKKGTSTYTTALSTMDTVKAAVIAAGNTYSCGGLTLQHGEQDFRNNLPAATYVADLLEWQSDYQTDCLAKSGGTDPMPLYLTQEHNWTVINSGFASCPTTDGACNNGNFSTPIAQWQVMRDYPVGQVILVGPTYQYAWAADGLHLTNAGYRGIGSLMAKVDYLRRTVGGIWRPLVPRRISCTGGSCAVTMWSRYSLTFDTSTVSDKGNCKGFEAFAADYSAIACSGAATISGNTVNLTFASLPTYIAYAYTGTAGQGGGTSGGPHGNLRNTDPTLGYYGEHVYDWAVTFFEAVGFSWGETPAPVRGGGVRR